MTTEPTANDTVIIQQAAACSSDATSTSNVNVKSEDVVHKDAAAVVTAAEGIGVEDGKEAVRGNGNLKKEAMNPVYPGGNTSNTSNTNTSKNENHNLMNTATAAMEATAAAAAAAVDKRPAKKSKKKWNTPSSLENMGRPKRPLSAYNLFFQDTRIEILNSKKSEEELEAEKAGGEDETGVATTGKRKRRVPHGKISFSQLGKEISAKWKAIKPEALEGYKARAAKDMDRYKKEIEEFNIREERRRAEERMISSHTYGGYPAPPPVPPYPTAPHMDPLMPPNGIPPGAVNPYNGFTPGMDTAPPRNSNPNSGHPPPYAPDPAAMWGYYGGPPPPDVQGGVQQPPPPQYYAPPANYGAAPGMAGPYAAGPMPPPYYGNGPNNMPYNPYGGPPPPPYYGMPPPQDGSPPYGYMDPSQQQQQGNGGAQSPGAGYPPAPGYHAGNPAGDVNVNAGVQRGAAGVNGVEGMSQGTSGRA